MREVEFVKSASLVTLGTPVTYVILTSAGSFLALHFPTDIQSSPEVAMHVSKKLSGDGPFEDVCDKTMPPNHLPRAFEVDSPETGAGAIWRIEITVGGSPQTRRLNLPFDVFRASSSGVNRLASPNQEDETEALGLLCLGGDLYQTFSRNRSVVSFAGKIRLDVNTNDERMPLSFAQAIALNKVVLQAVSLWVSGCRECRVDQLIVVNIGNDLYIRQGLNEWFMKTFSAPRADKNQTADLEQSLKESLESKVLLRAGPFLHEEPLRRKAFSTYVLEQRAIFKDLCELAPDRKVTPLLWDVRESLCSLGQLETGLSASIRVRFRDGRTACGTSANIIACRADSELTEFNIRDFRFAFSESEVPPLGRGEIEVGLLHVLMHEMGHWIGLQHMNSGHSIMAGSLSQSRCVDIPTMLALDRLDSASSAPVQVPPMAFTLTSKRSLSHRLRAPLAVPKRGI